MEVEELHLFKSKSKFLENWNCLVKMQHVDGGIHSPHACLGRGDLWVRILVDIIMSLFTLETVHERLVLEELIKWLQYFL
jgi:hypothetical protein